MPDTTQARRQKNRRAKLNYIAQAVGFGSWSKYETEILRRGKLSYIVLPNDVSAEQHARDMLERAGVKDAQDMTSGDLVEIANLIAGV